MMATYHGHGFIRLQDWEEWKVQCTPENWNSDECQEIDGRLQDMLEDI